MSRWTGSDADDDDVDVDDDDAATRDDEEGPTRVPAANVGSVVATTTARWVTSKDNMVIGGWRAPRTSVDRKFVFRDTVLAYEYVS